ncbi:MAG: beta-glucosidase, partial [Lachnospiraceae bacterium]|nr:beta-glucosidase [Lachnospiraceae bacterium]
GHGYFYWSYKTLADTVNTTGWVGWDAWDLSRSYDFGWFPRQ